MVENLRKSAGQAGERINQAREAAGERAAAARDAASARTAAARDAAVEKTAAARDAITAIKPRLRGVSHQWAFFVSLFLGVGLILMADGGRATLAAAVYAASLSALLGTSAVYHRVNWKRSTARMWMRRLDHSMIFFLIAGTYTPFALLVLDGPLADAILAVVWIGAIAGAIVEMIWVNRPKWVGALIYLSLGWVAIAAAPGLWSGLGATGTLLISAGGALYTIGAIVYATQRPDPAPAVFGYHEIFHALVIAAAALHFAVIAIFALPAAQAAEPARSTTGGASPLDASASVATTGAKASRSAPLRFTRTGVGGVRIGAPYAQLRSRGVVGPLRRGCPLGGPHTRSTQLLRSPLRAHADLTTTRKRRVRSISISRGARNRGVGIGSTIPQIRRAFGRIAVNRDSEEVFGITLVTVPKRSGGRFQFAVDVKTKRTTLIGIPSIAFCE